MTFESVAAEMGFSTPSRRGPPPPPPSQHQQQQQQLPSSPCSNSNSLPSSPQSAQDHDHDVESTPVLCRSSPRLLRRSSSTASLPLFWSGRRPSGPAGALQDQEQELEQELEVGYEGQGQAKGLGVAGLLEEDAAPEQQRLDSIVSSSSSASTSSSTVDDDYDDYFAASSSSRTASTAGTSVLSSALPSPKPLPQQQQLLSVQTSTSAIPAYRRPSLEEPSSASSTCSVFSVSAYQSPSFGGREVFGGLEDDWEEEEEGGGKVTTSTPRKPPAVSRKVVESPTQTIRGATAAASTIAPAAFTPRQASLFGSNYSISSSSSSTTTTTTLRTPSNRPRERHQPRAQPQARDVTSSASRQLLSPLTSDGAGGRQDESITDFFAPHLALASSKQKSSKSKPLPPLPSPHDISQSSTSTSDKSSKHRKRRRHATSTPSSEPSAALSPRQHQSHSGESRTPRLRSSSKEGSELPLLLVDADAAPPSPVKEEPEVLSKPLTIQLSIDQEGFRHIAPSFELINIGESIDVLEFAPSATATDADGATPPPGYPFHASMWQTPPVLRRIHIAGDSTRDFLFRQAGLGVRENGWHKVEGQGKRQGRKWCLIYQVEDRLSIIDKPMAGEKLFRPFRFFCAPDFLHLGRSKKINLFQLFYKTLLPKVDSSLLQRESSNAHPPASCSSSPEVMQGPLSILRGGERKVKKDRSSPRQRRKVDRVMEDEEDALIPLFSS